MNALANKTKKNAVPKSGSTKTAGNKPSLKIADNRNESVTQQKLQNMANRGVQVQNAVQLYSIANNRLTGTIQKKDTEEEELIQGKFKTIQKQGLEEEILQGKFNPAQRKEIEEEEPLQGKFTTVQKQGQEEEELLQGKFITTQRKGEEEEELLQGKFEPIQKKENNTGLPDNLKSGIENLSGVGMDDVKVHYNSDKPSTLQAHAYAQGTEIHVAPGQEKHLPHEAWHVVQQKQGRVKPTMQMKGTINVNDDVGLEKEADLMGTKASSFAGIGSSKKEDGQNMKMTLTQRNKFQSVNMGDIIQRWNIQGPTIDWNQTRLVEPLVSRPVMFFDDVTEDRIVVKGEDVSIGKTQLANMLHQQIHGTQTVYTRDITAQKNTINNIIDDPARSGNHGNWGQVAAKFPNILPPNYPNLTNLTPDEKGRKSREEHLNMLPKLQVMDFVPDKSAEDLSKPNGNAGGYKTLRALLLDKNYVQKLGQITAVDLFLENDDRVAAGNLGNWMTDTAGNITLIDQLNNNANALLEDDGQGANGIIGPRTGLNMLASGQINTTVIACVDAILGAMVRVGGDTTAKDWADEHGGVVRTKIKRNLEIGLRKGITELKKHLETKKMKGKGRSLKGGITMAENRDIRTGDGPDVQFWDRLKARARLLNN
jgi:hypothetical protein